MCRDEPEKAADLILMLWEKVETLAKKVGDQDAEIARLEAKLSKNSSNSSKPPSTDNSNPGGNSPAKNTSKDSFRKPGGQAGHDGATLKKSESSEHIVQLPKPERCTCGEIPSDGSWE